MSSQHRTSNKVVVNQQKHIDRHDAADARLLSEKQYQKNSQLTIPIYGQNEAYHLVTEYLPTNKNTLTPNFKNQRVQNGSS